MIPISEYGIKNLSPDNLYDEHISLTGLNYTVFVLNNSNKRVVWAKSYRISLKKLYIFIRNLANIKYHRFYII